MRSSGLLNRALAFAVLVGGGVALGRLVPSINNPWSIVMAVVAVVLGALAYKRYGFYGLLVMNAWLLWYPLTVQPLNAAGGPLTRGATLAELVLVVAGGLLAAQSLVRPKNAALGALPAVCALMIAVGWSLTIGVAPASLTMPSLRHVLYLVFLVLLCAQFVKTNAQAWLLIWGVVFSSFVQHGLIFWGQHVGGLPFYGGGIGVLEQDSSRLHGVYTLAGAVPVEVWGSRASGLLAMVVVILLLRVLYGSRRYLLPLLALLASFGAMLLFTGGRAGWIGLILGLVAVFLVSIRSSHLRTFGAAAGVTVISGLAALMYAASGFLSADFFERAASLGAITQESSWVTRVRFWELALALLRANPFGIGFDSLVTRYGVFEHNAYLWILNGAGPIGLLGICIAWGWIAYRSARMVKNGSHDAALLGAVSLAALVVILVAGLAENTPFLSEGPWIVWGAAMGLESVMGGRRDQSGSEVT